MRIEIQQISHAFAQVSGLQEPAGTSEEEEWIRHCGLADGSRKSTVERRPIMDNPTRSDPASELRVLLARAHVVCMWNSEIGPPRRGDVMDLTKTPKEALHHELKLFLPGFMEDHVAVDDVYQRCREIVSHGVYIRQCATLYDVLMGNYVAEVLRDCAAEFRDKHCYGCGFVDSCGMRGHPSQRRHECLMSDPVDRLETCFSECFKKVKKTVVINNFLDEADSNLL